MHLIDQKALALVAALLAAACSSDNEQVGDTAPGADSQAPQFASLPTLEVDPSGSAPLAGLITFETDEPAFAILVLDDAGQRRTVTPSTELTTAHRVPVLGVKPGRTIFIEVYAKDDADNISEVSLLEWATPELPALFPPLELRRGPEPGDGTQLAGSDNFPLAVTLFDADPAGLDEPVDYGMIVAVDERGEVVWYYVGEPQIGDVRRLPGGNLMYMYGRHGIVEIDMLGNVIQRWWAADVNVGDAPLDAILVNTDSFHHEVFPLESDDAAGDGELEADFITLSSELRTFPDYPASYTDPRESAETRVVSDTIVWFRRDGTVVKELCLFDVLDPYRLSWDSLGSFWDVVYGPGTADWSHANAVVRDPADGNLILSLRHQDALVKVDISTGEVLWILGDPAGWELPWSEELLTGLPDGAGGGAEFEWPYHQHAPELTPEGTIMLFDNGNGRAVAPEPELALEDRYSRALELRVDEDAGEVRRVWSFGGPGAAWYSRFLGDADLLPDGNVLVCDGGKVAGTGEDAVGYARLFEVSRSSTPSIVWELVIADRRPGSLVSWNVYRSARLSSLYPSLNTTGE